MGDYITERIFREEMRAIAQERKAIGRAKWLAKTAQGRKPRRRVRRRLDRTEIGIAEMDALDLQHLRACAAGA